MALSEKTILKMNDNSIRVAGGNSYGELIVGDRIDKNTFVKIQLENVKRVSISPKNTLLLMNDGTVKGVGENRYGELGLGHANNVLINPVNINISNVKQIECGYNHTVFLMNDGTVKVTGSNGYGQLGLGNTTSQTTLQTLSLQGVKQVACGGGFTMFLMNDGTVKSVGYNYYGQLGLGHNTTPVSNISNVNINGVSQIFCGYEYAIFAMKDGTFKGVGSNSSGQLGLGNTAPQYSPVTMSLSNVEQIALGSEHTMVLLKDGTVVGAGSNSYGQLGNRNTISQSSFVSAGISGVKNIWCGWSHTMFLQQDGTLRGVGHNEQGQIGIGNITNQSSLQTVSLTGIASMGDILIKVLRKILFKSGSIIKSLKTGVWSDIGAAPVAKEVFLSEGVDLISPDMINMIKQLESPEMLIWSEEKGGGLKLKSSGVPVARVVKGINEIKISELKSVRIVASTTGTVRVLISSDSGVTWKGKQTVDITKLDDVKQYGFTPTELNALTEAQLATLAPNKQIRFVYYLEQTSSTDSASVSAMYVNEKKYTGTPNVGPINLTSSLAKMDLPFIELKENDGTWIPVNVDEMVYAKKGKEWSELQLRVKMRNDQGLNAIAYSWS